MAKQTHDPRIWRQGWFIALPINYKVLYMFASDHANQAGIWRTDKLYFEELNKGVRIDFDKFLEAVNEHGDHISVLPDNTWFLNYHITSMLGNIYKPRYDKMVKALKIAFLSGVPLEWIKGFTNPDKIDKEAVENSYIQTAIKFTSGLPKENVLAPQHNNTQNNKPETKVKQLNGVAPNFIMPEISYTSFGSEKDAEIETWLEVYSFSEIVKIKNINSPDLLCKYVKEFIESVQLKRFMDVDAISDYFGPWMRPKPKGADLSLTNGIDPPHSKTSNGKFSSVKKYQDLKSSVRNDHNTKNNNDKKN